MLEAPMIITNFVDVFSRVLPQSLQNSGINDHTIDLEATLQNFLGELLSYLFKNQTVPVTFD